MSYQNIPQELKDCPNWLVWKYENTPAGIPTKVPYNLKTGWKAAKNDRANHFTFNEVIAAAWNGYSGIGFALTEEAGFAGIDMDKCHQMAPEIWAKCQTIINEFDSYTEYSPSGNGLHIIIKARFPKSRLRNGIELYTQPAYLTFTGNIYGALKPVAERQELAMRLFNEMGDGADKDDTPIYSGPRVEENQIIIDRAANVEKTGPLFRRLWVGDFAQLYQSQSQADQAIFNLIQFQTKNVDQIVEIFHASALGKREKAYRKDYIEGMIKKSFDQTLPPIDTTELMASINDAINKKREPVPVQLHHNSNSHELSIDLNLWRNVNPPGLMNDIAEFVYQSAPRPIREIALATAIGIMAGVCGRAFNYSGTGLNLYIMMLAETGRGKEAMASGASKLFKAVGGGDEYKSAWNYLGPSDMASGAGLLRRMNDPTGGLSFVSITGEVGKRMQQMASSTGNMAEKQLQRVLLDIFMKSGAGESYQGSAYSDKKNNIDLLHSPAFTWLGEGTPSTFYEALDEKMIESGLLPRFIILSYNGDRPPLNQNILAKPPQTLVTKFRELIVIANSINQTGDVVNVSHTPEADSILSRFNEYCDNKINKSHSGLIIELWSRAHVKSFRIASLLAIAHNMSHPVIDAQMAQWAISLVVSDVNGMVDKFDKDEIGAGVSSEARKVIATAVVKVMTNKVQLNPVETSLQSKAVISRTTISRLSIAYKVFKENARLFNETIEEMIKLGAINRLQKDIAMRDHGSTAELFQVTNMAWCLEHVKR